MAHRSPVPWLAGLPLLVACNLTLPWSTTKGEGTLSAEPASLRFTARQGDSTPPAAQTVVVRNRTGHALGIEFDASWLSATPAYDKLLVQPLPPDALAVGTHAGEIRLWPCDVGPVGCTAVPGAAPFAIAVTYTIEPSPLTLEPAGVRLELVDGVSNPATATLALADEAGPGDWTAGSSLDLGCPFGAVLQVAPASGTAVPAQLGLTATLHNLYQEGDCTGEVRVDKGGRTARTQVTLHARRPTLSVAPARLDFGGVAYQLPLAAPQTLAVTAEGGISAWVWARVSPASADWLSIREGSAMLAPGDLTIAISRSDLAPGTHAASIEVQLADPAAPVMTIPVTYTLEGRALRVTPYQWAPMATGLTVPSELTQVLDLTDGGSAIDWTATSSAPWLAIAPAAGTTGPGSRTTLSILPAELEALPSGTVAGSVTFSYAAPGGAPEQAVVPVTLGLWIPRLARIMPRAIAAGAPSRAAVFGDAPSDVLLDGSQLGPIAWGGRTGFFSLPALAAGTHPIGVPNALGLVRSRASLLVLDRIARTAAVVAAPGRKTRLAFDDASGALFAANAGAGTMERFREAAGWARESLALAGLRDASLAPDGATLAAVAAGEVRVVDAASLALAAPQPATPAIPEAGAAAMDWRIVHGVDGRALIVRPDAEAGLYAFDGTAVAPIYQSPAGWGEPATSGDGGMVWIVRADAPALPVALYQPDGGSYWTPGANVFSADHVAVDRGGVHVLCVRGGADSMLLDTRFMGPVAGKLPASVVNAVLTQDGTRAVAWDPVAGRVRLFDLGGALSAGLFPEVGTGVVPGADPGPGAVMALSTDDATLFLAGDQRVVVVPLP